MERQDCSSDSEMIDDGQKPCLDADRSSACEGAYTRLAQGQTDRKVETGREVAELPVTAMQDAPRTATVMALPAIVACTRWTWGYEGLPCALLQSGRIVLFQLLASVRVLELHGHCLTE